MTDTSAGERAEGRGDVVRRRPTSGRTGRPTSGRTSRRTAPRAAAVLAALVLGAVAVTGCTETRPPMLQPVAPVPDVTGTG